MGQESWWRKSRDPEVSRTGNSPASHVMCAAAPVTTPEAAGNHQLEFRGDSISRRWGGFVSSASKGTFSCLRPTSSIRGSSQTTFGAPTKVASAFPKGLSPAGAPLAHCIHRPDAFHLGVVGPLPFPSLQALTANLGSLCCHSLATHFWVFSGSLMEVDSINKTMPAYTLSRLGAVTWH